MVKPLESRDIMIKDYLKTKTEKHFYNGLKERTLEQKYQYLKNHYEYDIMNSWNGLKSIANKVKIYELGFSSDEDDKYYEIMSQDYEYFDYIYRDIIEEYEKLTGTDVFFNGRSGGYLVVVPSFENTHRNEHLFDYLGLSDIKYYDTYKDFKAENYNNSYKNEIENAYYIVKAFDKLCDNLREATKQGIKEF